MSSQSFLESIARRCGAHPWRTLAAWGVALVVALALTVTLLGGALTSEGAVTNNPESQRADTLINERLHAEESINELVVLRSAVRTVDEPIFQQRANDVLTAATGLGSDVVKGGAIYTTVPDLSLISRDRHATVIPVSMAGTQTDAEKNVDALSTAVKRAGQGNGFDVLVTGGPSINRDFTQIGESDLKSGELFGIGVALIILVLVFGALVAAGIPLLLSVVSIILAMGMAAIVGQFLELSTFITNMITMIGLAMGIDYSLFIVSRYREERGAGRPKLDAIARTGGTAGRAVLFSGGSVIVALGGLLLVPMSIFHSMALGAMFAVFAALLAALTLLPALLGLLGDRVNSLRVPFLGSARNDGHPGETGFWDRVAHGVMARPVVSLIVACLVLLAAAASTCNRQGVGRGRHPPGRQGVAPGLRHAVRGLPLVPDGQRADRRERGGRRSGRPTGDGLTWCRHQGRPGVQGRHHQRDQPSRRPDGAHLPSAAGQTDEQARAAVQRLRTQLVPVAFAGVPATVLVTGQTAYVIDYLATINEYTPWVFLFVLGLSFVFLTVVFRSLVVPLKAILMNLLSVGAAYGLMVVVFQKGWGADLLGLQQVDYIEAWMPLFLFAILFGTSMDYHVFLLSRIREHFDQGNSNTESVAFGLRIDREDHHRRSDHHGGGVRRVRRRAAGHVPATRVRAGGGGAPRCHARAHACSCRPPCACSATPTGGSRSGSTGYPTYGWRRAHPCAPLPRRAPPCAPLPRRSA